MMTCAEFCDCVFDYIDDTLAPARARSAAEHVDGCSACAALLDSSRQMLHWMADDALLAMPDDIGLRLHARLHRELDPEPARLRPVTSRARRPWYLWRPGWVAAMVLLLLTAGISRFRAGATTTSGWLMDRHCMADYHGKLADHSRDCLMSCVAYGYGVLDAHGHFTAFDVQSSRRVLTMLQHAHRQNRMWVKVEGNPMGNHTLDVKSVALATPPTADLGQSR